jgi:hypothetical protein
MASISLGKPAHDGRPRYVVNYRDPEGRQRRKTFRRKAEAVAFRNTVEADKLRRPTSMSMPAGCHFGPTPKGGSTVGPSAR